MTQLFEYISSEKPIEPTIAVTIQLLLSSSTMSRYSAIGMIEVGQQRVIGKKVQPQKLTKRSIHSPVIRARQTNVAPNGNRKCTQKKYWAAAGKVMSMIGSTVGQKRRSFQSTQKSQSPAVSMKWTWKPPIMIRNRAIPSRRSADLMAPAASAREWNGEPQAGASKLRVITPPEVTARGSSLRKAAIGLPSLVAEPLRWTTFPDARTGFPRLARSRSPH